MTREQLKQLGFEYSGEAPPSYIFPGFGSFDPKKLEQMASAYDVIMVLVKDVQNEALERGAEITKAQFRKLLGVSRNG